MTNFNATHYHCHNCFVYDRENVATNSYTFIWNRKALFQFQFQIQFCTFVVLSPIHTPAMAFDSIELAIQFQYQDNSNICTRNRRTVYAFIHFACKRTWQSKQNKAPAEHKLTPTKKTKASNWQRQLWWQFRWPSISFTYVSIIHFEFMSADQNLNEYFNRGVGQTPIEFHPICWLEHIIVSQLFTKKKIYFQTIRHFL